MLENKSENYFTQYLKNISNEQLIQFYNDVEWTPFPVLVIKEYQHRFNAKNKKEVTEKLRLHVAFTKEKRNNLRVSAKNQTSKISHKIRNKGEHISPSVNLKHLASSEKNLAILGKVGELNKKGVVTNKEFQDKKREILKRI